MKSTNREIILRNKKNLRKFKKAKKEQKRRKRQWRLYLVEMSKPTGQNQLTPSRSLISSQIYFAVSSVMGMSSPLRSNSRAFSRLSKEKTLLPKLNPEQGRPVLSLSVFFRE